MGDSGSYSTDVSSGDSNNSIIQKIRSIKFWQWGLVVLLIALIIFLVIWNTTDDSSGGAGGGGNGVNTGGQPQMSQYAPLIDVSPSTGAVLPARNIPSSNTPSPAPSPTVEAAPAPSPSPQVEEVPSLSPSPTQSPTQSQSPPVEAAPAPASSCSVTYETDKINSGVADSCVAGPAGATGGASGTSIVDIPQGTSCNFTCGAAGVLSNSEGSDYDFSGRSNPNFTCNDGQNYSFICLPAVAPPAVAPPAVATPPTPAAPAAATPPTPAAATPPGAGSVVCTPPANIAEYNVTENQRDVSLGFNVTSTTCATGYEGDPVVTACTESGEYELSGCDPIVCTQPGDISGYVVTESDLSVPTGFSVAAACAAGYEGTAAVHACTTSGEYTLSGCTLPAELPPPSSQQPPPTCDDMNEPALSGVPIEYWRGLGC